MGNANTASRSKCWRFPQTPPNLGTKVSPQAPGESRRLSDGSRRRCGSPAGAGIVPKRTRTKAKHFRCPRRRGAYRDWEVALVAPERAVGGAWDDLHFVRQEVTSVRLISNSAFSTIADSSSFKVCIGCNGWTACSGRPVITAS